MSEVKIIDRRSEDQQEEQTSGGLSSASDEAGPRIVLLDESKPEQTEELPTLTPRVIVFCESCRNDIAEYCNWLPFPAGDRMVMLRILPIVCPLCGNNVINQELTPIDQRIAIPKPDPRLNRAMRRHPERFGLKPGA